MTCPVCDNITIAIYKILYMCLIKPFGLLFCIIESYRVYKIFRKSNW